MRENQFYKLIILILCALLAISMATNFCLLASGDSGKSAETLAIVVKQKEQPRAKEQKSQLKAIKAPAPVEEKVYYKVPLSHDLQDFIRERCEAYGVDIKLALAVAKVESGFVADSISETGDYGIMQINSVNHTWLSEMLDINDYLDPYQNFEAGLYMLNHAYLNGDTPHKALMVYNMGYSGAFELWEQGITETAYSHAVIQAYEEIEAKK